MSRWLIRFSCVFRGSVLKSNGSKERPMTVYISLPPETEARLRDRAAATGKDVSTLVREAVEEKFSAGNGNSAGMSYERWSAEFTAWMKDVAKRATMYPPGYVADDSRDSIYEGRGE